MKIREIAENKGLNLSVTAQEQNCRPARKQALNSKNDKFAFGEKTINQLPKCADGVCQVTWKPLHRSA